MRFNVKKLWVTAFAVAVCLLSAVFMSGCSSRPVTPDIAPHLIETPETAPERVIDGREEQRLSAIVGELTPTQYRARVNELYATVVYDKKKPIFCDNDPVEPIYVAARAVLDRYVLNGWHSDDDGEYNIVHTIHDYLACNVDYDFELFDMYKNGNTDIENNAAFYMDGVFLNGRAVCDGISRAFDFLCAIDGVDSFRVTGSFASAPHAWNKVKINGEWFNVDVTSDCAYYVGTDGAYRKQLSHGFFLLSDDTLKQFENGHVFERQPYVAQSDYNYYEVGFKRLYVNGKMFDAVIRSQTKLNELFEAIAESGDIGKIEIMLDFPSKTQVNSVDMYVDEIREAYGLVKSDFDTSRDLPYFRYPNGVYLFLIYR